VCATPDLLDGNAPEDTIDQPSVIIGKGKLGTALFQMGMGEDIVLGRGEPIPDTLPYSSGKGDGGVDGEEERGKDRAYVQRGFPVFPSVCDCIGSWAAMWNISIVVREFQQPPAEEGLDLTPLLDFCRRPLLYKICRMFACPLSG